MSVLRINKLATAFGIRAARTYPDTVTFKRPTNVVDSVGGTTTSYAATLPADVPCKYVVYRGSQKETGNKIIADSDYMLTCPAYYGGLVDVDAACQAVIAARTSGEPARTFVVDWVGRKEGIEIEMLVSIES